MTNYDGRTGVAMVTPRALWVGSLYVDGETYLYHNDFMVEDPERRTVLNEDNTCNLKVAYHVVSRDIQETRAVASIITNRRVLSRLEGALNKKIKEANKMMPWLNSLLKIYD